MDLDFSPLIDSWRFIASGLGLTILLSVAAVVCSFVLGLAVGLGRMYGPGWLRVLLVFYCGATGYKHHRGFYQVRDLFQTLEKLKSIDA